MTRPFTATRCRCIILRRHVILFALAWGRNFRVARINLSTPYHSPIFACIYWAFNKVIHLGVVYVLNLHFWSLSRVTTRFSLLFAILLVFICKHPQRVFNLIWLHGVVWISSVYILIDRLYFLIDFAWLGNPVTSWLLAFNVACSLLWLYLLTYQFQFRSGRLTSDVLTFGLSNEAL